jgi:hypothetical protein
MLIAQTSDPDDTGNAVREILAQLDLSRNQMRHSMGLVHCHNAFVESGALKAVCARLPFPVLGYNTYLHSSSLGAIENMLMTATVLTSDTVKFSAGLSSPIHDDVRGPTAAMYVETENLLRGRPAMGIIFPPKLTGLATGEILTEALDEVSDGVPFFGGQPADYTTYLRDPKVFFNGEDYHDRAAMVLIEGDVRPRFHVFPVSAEKRIRQKAIITASERNVVKEVNGMPVLDFMESLGLCFEGKMAGTTTIPLFLDRWDGSPPTVRSILAQTPEGWLILSGRAPIDSTLGIGAMDETHILEGVRRVTSLARLSRPEVFVLYSCLSRNVSLGFNYKSEAEAVRLGLDGNAPYLFAYTSGEICPVMLKDGKWHNEYHNMSLVTFSF